MLSDCIYFRPTGNDILSLFPIFRLVTSGSSAKALTVRTVVAFFCTLSATIVCAQEAKSGLGFEAYDAFKAFDAFQAEHKSTKQLRSSSGTRSSTHFMASGLESKSDPDKNIPVPLSNERGDTTVYRMVSPDGRVSYGDTVLKGHKVEKIIQNDFRASSGLTTKEVPLTLGVDTGTRANGPSASSHLAAQRLAQRSTPLEAAKARLNEVQSRHDLMNNAVTNIDDVREGERTMNVNGSSRLNESYFERQKQQREELTMTKAQLDDATDKLRSAEQR